MLLNLRELVETEQKLKAIISHTNEELTVVQLLIKGMEMRAGEADNNNSKHSLFQDMVYQVDRFEGHWFTGREVTDKLIAAGVRKSKDRTKLQSIIASYLKKLFDQKKLIRENIEPNTARGKFRYKQKVN